jgi:hypothetical protein
MARNEGKCGMVMRLLSPSTFTTYPENENFAQSVLLLKKRKKGNKNNNKKTHTNSHFSNTQNEEIKLPHSPPSSSLTTRDHFVRPPASDVEFCRRGWRLQPPQN